MPESLEGRLDELERHMTENRETLDSIHDGMATVTHRLEQLEGRVAKFPRRSEGLDSPSAPTRRDGESNADYTGALVYVTDPRAAAENRPTGTCPPCDRLVAALHRRAEGTRWRLGTGARDHFRFVRFDEDAPVRGTPTIRYFRDGREVGRIEGLPADIRRVFVDHPLAERSTRKASVGGHAVERVAATVHSSTLVVESPRLIESSPVITETWWPTTYVLPAAASRCASPAADWPIGWVGPVAGPDLAYVSTAPAFVDPCAASAPFGTPFARPAASGFGMGGFGALGLFGGIGWLSFP